jgi:hypothetical protein
MIKTTKQIAAYRQLVAAIEHLHNKDYECAITLAGAAEGLVKEKTTNHLFRLIRKKFSPDETNAYITWLKHPTGSDGAEITEQEVVITIIRAIQKYVGTYQTNHPHFVTFSEWCVANGYTKKSLMEKA